MMIGALLLTKSTDRRTVDYSLAFDPCSSVFIRVQNAFGNTDAHKFDSRLSPRLDRYAAIMLTTSTQLKIASSMVSPSATAPWIPGTEAR